jgi:glycosyltransferase involved in cell wall biosynthesis
MSLPLISVIVPTYNSGGYLANCLRSILQQSYSAIELIVVDNGSTDNTKAIARQYTPYVYNHGPERSAQRNYGVAQSHGDFVLIIDSDMELSANVVSECIKTIKTNTNLKAIIIPEESFGEGFWAQCKQLERSFYSGIDWQEAARFFDRNVYETLGGYDEHMLGGEDYDLANRVEYAHGKASIARIEAFIYHNERQLHLSRLLRKKFYYATTLSCYLRKDTNQARLRQQTSVWRRYQLFFAQPAKLFADPIVGVGMLLMKTCEFAAGLAGYWLSNLRIAQPQREQLYNNK